MCEKLRTHVNACRPADTGSRQTYYSMMVNTWVTYVQPGCGKTDGQLQPAICRFNISETKQSGGRAWAAQTQA